MMLVEDKTKRRETFVFYAEWNDALEEATCEEFFQMMKAIIKYGTEGEEPVFESKYLRGLWHGFKLRLDRDMEKYKNVCERNKINGEKGGRPPKNPDKPKKPSGIFGNPDKPKKPEYEYEDEYESEGDTFSFNAEPSRMPSFKQWTEQQFIDEVRKHPEQSDIAAEFIDYWTETDGKGKMRFQAQKFFEVKKRLASWRKNNFSRSQGGNTQTPQTASELKTFDAF